MKCYICKAPLVDIPPHKMRYYKTTGRGYCGPECSWAYRKQISSLTAARTNRRYASERMKARNPMRKKETREKVSRTLRRIGHAPAVRGGNGHPSSRAVSLLSTCCSPLGFVPEYAVRTGKKTSNKYPTVYKIDLAHPVLKIAIEVDGSSHRALERQKQDRKKERFLTGHGWTVLRFTNQTVLTESGTVLSSIISKLQTSILIPPTES